MDFNILEKEKDKILIEFPTEGYTLLNPIVEELWKEKEVLEATVIKEHPFLSTSKLWLVAPNPKTKLKKATERLLKNITQLKEAIKKI